MNDTPSQVFKFGGTSLGTPGRLSRVLELIQAAANDRLAVVVSALGETTDWLLAASDLAGNGRAEAGRNEIIRVRRLTLETAAQVLIGDSFEEFAHFVGRTLEGVERTLVLNARDRDGPPEQQAELLAVGEVISATLVAAALQARGVQAQFVDARDFLVTQTQGGTEAIDWPATKVRFADAVRSWNTLPVVTGFIARTSAGKTTTLGRNGSDYTATLLAALLAAKDVTVWTDVLGVMTADPALVSEAVPVDRLSYDEALELAYFGTRMFHPRTIIPLRENGASLSIKSTTDPEAPGTRIDSKGNPDPNRPTCVTSLEHLSLLGVNSRRAEVGRPIAGKIVSVLSAVDIGVWLTTESTLGQSFSIVVPQADETRARQLIRVALAAELDRGDVTLIEPRAPVTMVTLVGEAMGHRPNVAGRFLSAIGRSGISVRAIAQNSSERSISCMIDAADTPVAVRTVHAAFNLSHAELSVFLLGKGVVGKSLLDQLNRQDTVLRIQHDVHVRLVGLGCRAGALVSPYGLDPRRAIEQLKTALANGLAESDIRSFLPALSRLPNPVLVDCTGADGMESHYCAAFAAGINVVSANKKPLALRQAEYDELKAAARRHYRAYHYETTVGAALPVIETLKNLVRTGDTVIRIEGAFSGTLGFLCERLAAGEPLSAAVRLARERGFTEPNPRDDLSGMDVARKALILARELGLRVDLSDVSLEPLVPAHFLHENDPEKFIASLSSADSEIAARVRSITDRGHLLRYLACIEPSPSGARIIVGPQEVPPTHPAASLGEGEGFVAFHTERYRQYPLIVRGAGAGGEVTASGVLADILRLGANIRGRG